MGVFSFPTLILLIFHCIEASQLHIFTSKLALF